MERLPEAVSNALSQLPEVSLCRVEYNTSAIDIGPDLEIALEVQGRPVSLLVELKMNAYPRDVRALVSQLDSYRAWTRQRHIL